jgi:hypothetical protein
MILEDFTLERLAELICGDDKSFAPVYRSSWYLTQFFVNVGLSRFKHDGTTRKIWVMDCLRQCSGEELEKVVLGLASLKAYKGNVEHLGLALKSLNEALNPEGFNVEVNSVKPVLKAIEPRLYDSLNSTPNLTKLTNPTDPKLVFVIIAFRDDMEPVFEGIKAAGESVGLSVKRVMDVIGDYRITDQIIQMINSARFIVADLTLERPNVYFELGYARGLGKNVITIAREGTNIHFDIKDWTYISYNDSRVLEQKLRKRFEFELSKTESA